MTRRAWLIRLQCPCSRNVADVSATGTPATTIEVRHRVPHSEYPVGAPQPTYTWNCPCGREHRCRHDRLAAAYLGAARGRVDYLILGNDL